MSESESGSEDDSGGIKPDRLVGKGDRSDDGDGDDDGGGGGGGEDPAGEFEDNPTSAAADDAQQTVEQFADGETNTDESGTSETDTPQSQEGPVGSDKSGVSGGITGVSASEAGDGTSEPSDESESGSAPDEAEFEQFERGDEKFLQYGDEVTFTKDGETYRGEYKTTADENLHTVEVDGERVGVETHQIESYHHKSDSLDDIRNELRDHFDDIQHSRAIESWTDDGKYRDFQTQTRDGVEEAKESPAYDMDPRMEEASAILATADEDTAQTLCNIQSQSKNSLPREMTVYRGIDTDTDDFLEQAETAMENGKALSDPGFQATSINRDVAEGFGNVTLEVQTDHGVYTRAASEHAGEDEILLPAGTEFEVVNVDRSNNVVQVEAHGGYDFNGIDVGFIRDQMEEDGITYAEAVENVI